MLQAVLYFHEDIKLTHMELMPQNILVGEVLGDNHTRGYLDIKLADFDSAKLFNCAGDGTCIATVYP